ITRASMQDFVARLRLDHANVSRLLCLLEQQVAAVVKDGRPDWNLVQAIVDYLLAYPELAHHPLENLLIAQLQMKDPDAADPLIAILGEHRELVLGLRHLAAATRLARQGAARSCAVFTDLAAAFLAAQRDHIRREDRLFLPAVAELLDATDRRLVALQAPMLDDPLFGADVNP